MNVKERKSHGYVDNMGLALSCAWNSHRHQSGKEIIYEIKELGFNEVELNFSLTQGMVDEIGELVERGEVKINSLHNFCPIPDGLTTEEALPDCYSMSSKDERERRQALYYTKKTIDTAQKLNAQAVVLHCGRTEMIDHTKELIELYQKGLSQTTEFLTLRDRIIKERNLVAPPYFANTLKSLEELDKYAKEKGVSLGIENRFYYREIPSLEEISIILDKFKGSQIFFWFDSGHAKVWEDLGFNSLKDYLELYRERIIGIHLHNVLNCIDHQAPLNGEIDFNTLKPYIKKENLKVIESHYPKARAQDIKMGKLYLEEVFNGKI